MAFRSLVVIPIALAVFPGCVSSQESADAARILRADSRASDSQAETNAGPETKVGVIDMMEVLKRTNIGQPAIARWRGEFEQATRTEQQYLTQFHRPREYSSSVANPWFMAFRNAVNAIMPKVETVTKVLAEEHGFAIVLVKGNPNTVMTTFYSADTFDLTDQVIEELNQRYP